MKNIIFIWAFTILSSLSAKSQVLHGKWYMANRSGLIEFEFNKDSVCDRKLYNDFKLKEGKQVECGKFDTCVFLKDRILLIGKLKNDSVKFSSRTFFDFHTDKYLKMAWNGVSAKSSIDSLLLYNLNDKSELFGYYMFSEKYLDSLKLLTPIDSMSLRECLLLVNKVNSKIKAQESEVNKSSMGYGVFILSHQYWVESLFEMGFYPLQNTMTLNNMLDKYKENSEFKALMNNKVSNTTTK